MMDYLHKVTHMIAKDKKYDIQHIPFSNKLKKWVGKNHFVWMHITTCNIKNTEFLAKKKK